MKKIFYIIVCVLISLAVNAQEKEWNMLKHNKEYLWGEGVAATETEADKQALSNLINQISVSVSDVTTIDNKSTNKNGSLDESSQFHQSVQTYSKQTLNNTTRYVMGKAPNIKVGRAIKKSEITKMFEDRANKAKEMMSSGLRAEKKGKIDDALRNYYWSLTLLKSLQYPNAVTYTDGTGTSHIMTNWIKERMEDIFDDVKYTCMVREGDDVDLSVTYKDKPVNSAAFTYYDGRQWSPIVTARDGFAKLEFVKGFSKGTYQLRTEYQFKSAAKTDPDLEPVLGAVTGSEFRRCNVEIKGIKPPKNDEIKKSSEAEAVKAASLKGTFTSTNAKVIKAPTEVADRTPYLNIVSTVERAIRRKQTANIQQYFTADGWDIYKSLIEYGSAKVVGVPTYTFYENANEVTARGLALSFSFKNGVKKSFVEEVIFTFDANRKIDNISFGLGKTAEDDILNKGKWDESVRLTIMNFLENYKTAYALKRYDYIKSIFDDDAIIITGRIVKKQGISKDINGKQLGGNVVKFNRQTKDQYLRNLKTCFDSQEFINIQFAENTVKRAAPSKGQVYGIQIEQDYYSATYGDHGYLFLYVDMNDPKTPLIKVRTWQPTKDASLGPSGIYGLADFE